MKYVAAPLTSILVAAVSALAAQAPAKSRVETGSIGDAAYRIEIPANWNKGLVLIVHGYTQPTPAMLEGAGVQQSQDVFLSRGFAIATSLFSLKAYTVKSPQGFAEGYAAKEGLEDTEMLRRHFVAVHGKPERTYVVGQSMGAIVTIALLERYPDEYDGALPMCGPLVSATEFFNLALLDLMVTFDYLFPNVLGSPFAVNGDITAKVRAALEAAPDKASVFANRVQRPLASLPAVIAFYQRIAAELVQRAGGNPFDNANRVYRGFGDDAALNGGVKRYRADPKARAYLRQYYSPTGRIQDPVLTLMSLGDQLVPPNWAADYEFQAVREGTQDLFAVRFVDGQGHCSFNARQMAEAFDALVAWDRDGKRPQ